MLINPARRRIWGRIDGPQWSTVRLFPGQPAQPVILGLQQDARFQECEAGQAVIAACRGVIDVAAPGQPAVRQFRWLTVLAS